MRRFGIWFFCSGLFGLLGLLDLLGNASVIADETNSVVGSAVAAAERSGRPIFAMAGRDSCPACVRLLDRLQNDRTLARYATSFIPIKISIESNRDEFSAWDRKYSVASNAIPRVYVVRADGEKIYADAGAPLGDELPRMLDQALLRSGRVYNDAEAMLLSQAVEAAEKSVEDKNHFATAHALARLHKLGSPGNLGSFAKAALRADELYSQLKDNLEAESESAKATVTADADDFPAMVQLAQAEAAHLLFAELKPKAASLTRELKKDQEFVKRYAAADALVKAQALTYSDKASLRSRAVAAYAAVIKRFPGTLADEAARKELAAIAPEAAVLSSTDETSLGEPNDDSPKRKDQVNDYRQWKSRAGTSTTAKFLQQKSGKVQLQLPDGKKIVVDMAQLSDNDQAYLRER